MKKNRDNSYIEDSSVKDNDLLQINNGGKQDFSKKKPENKLELEKKKSVGQYGDSIISRFFLLNDKGEHEKSKKNIEEEWVMPRKKPNIWKKMFCCYEENNYE